MHSLSEATQLPQSRGGGRRWIKVATTCARSNGCGVPTARACYATALARGFTARRRACQLIRLFGEGGRSATVIAAGRVVVVLVRRVSCDRVSLTQRLQ
jgi:hypothetical protein